jgi:hypothetical protein
MALFRNTADLKLYTDVHKQTDWSTIRLYVQQAEATYIIPITGSEMYKNYSLLINDPANASKPFEEIFVDEKDVAAFNFIAVALANYALYEAFPFLNTGVGDIGVIQQSSKEGTTTPAAQWRYEGRRFAHLISADRAIDNLLLFMEFNATFFEAWAGSLSYTINKDLFIDDSYKLNKYIGTGGSRRAYLALRPHLRLAEKKYIMPAIGQALFEELKEQLQSNPPTLSSDNKNLLPLIEESVAWAAYYEGLPFMAVKFNNEGVQVLSSSDGINNKQVAGTEEKNLARVTAGRNADAFLGTLKKYMVDNYSSYPLFENSTAYDNSNPRYRRPVNYYNSGMFRI